MPATRAQHNKLVRSIAFGAGAIAAPLAIGAGLTALTRSRRTPWIAGGVALGLAAALRWQLQRWFTDEPAYTVERRIGALEIRRYAPRIEAHTRVAALDFETALDEGFRTLAGYLFGGNRDHRALAMTTPVLAIPRAQTHTVAFVMPPGRALADLPAPADERVQLVEVPERRVAVLRSRGRYDDPTIAAHIERLHELVADAELEPAGQPMFAGFDPPSTLPWLRRSEVWVELE